MTFRLAPFVFLALLFLPFFVSAEDTGPTSSVYCPHITQTLIRGDCDEGLNRDWCLRHVQNQQVTELQHFLSDYYDIEPEEIMTGYFGNFTQRKVRDFQREQNLPAFGIVGPLTRDAIKRVCGTQTTPTPPPPPINPAAPTCTLSVNPSSITLGQSSTLSWTSTNATHGVIIPLFFNPLPLNGSQSVFPTQTTTYQGYFWGGVVNSIARCETTLTVTSLPLPPPATTTVPAYSCRTPWGSSLTSGQSVIAYKDSSAPAGQTCQSETRLCILGHLTGSFQYERCSVQAQTTNASSCTVAGQVYADGTSVNITPWLVGDSAYASAKCSNGLLCGVDGNPPCLNPNFLGGSNQCKIGGITVLCSGQSTTSTNPTASTSSCIYKGTTYGEGKAVLDLVSCQGLEQYLCPWNTGNLYVCRAGSFRWERCSWGNATGPFYNGQQMGSCWGTPASPQPPPPDGAAPSPPSITITAPPAGTSVAKGSTLYFAWTSQNAPNTVTTKAGLFWIHPNGYEGQFGGWQPTTGSLSFSTGDAVVGQNKFRVKLVQLGPTSVPNILATAEVPITITSGGTTGTGGTTASLGSCTYKGQTYAEGAAVSVFANIGYWNATCDNGTWLLPETSYRHAGVSVCDGTLDATDFGCGAYTAKAYLAVIPRHGNSPLTVSVATVPFCNRTTAGMDCEPYTLSWGDGKKENFSQRHVNSNAISDVPRDRSVHAYTAPASYVITSNGGGLQQDFARVPSNSANIRVDAAGTTLAPQSSQLASALSAIESALQAILKLLGQ